MRYIKGFALFEMLTKPSKDPIYKELGSSEISLVESAPVYNITLKEFMDVISKKGPQFKGIKVYATEPIGPSSDIRIGLEGGKHLFRILEGKVWFESYSPMVDDTAYDLMSSVCGKIHKKFGNIIGKDVASWYRYNGLESNYAIYTSRGNFDLGKFIDASMEALNLESSFFKPSVK